MGLFEEVEALNSDHFKFSVYLVDGRYEEAKALLDKHQEEKPGSWRNNARWYYRVADGKQGLTRLSEAVERTIEYWDSRSYPWREQCATNIIYDMRLIGHEDTDAIDSMLAQCETEFEARLRVGYICPCEAEQLVHYTILDNRFDEAVERAEQWLASWPTVKRQLTPFSRSFPTGLNTRNYWIATWSWSSARSRSIWPEEIPIDDRPQRH